MWDWIRSLLSDDLMFTAASLVGGAALLVWVLRWVRRAEKERQEKLAQLRIREAVKTTSPVDDPAASAQARARRSITAQSTVVRRVLFPLLVIVILVVASIPYLGQVSAASLSFIATAVAVLLGIAARPVVENAFAGLAMGTSKLFNIGDTVKLEDMYGTIEDITITHTTIKVWDWRRYVVPNTKMMQSSVINYSLFDRFIWTYTEFWLAYDADLDLVRKLAVEAPKRSQAFAGYEEPQFWIMEMGKESYRCWVAAWADNSADAWTLAADVRTSLIVAFRKHGIRAHGFRHEMAGEHAPDKRIPIEIPAAASSSS